MAFNMENAEVGVHLQINFIPFEMISLCRLITMFKKERIILISNRLESQLYHSFALISEG